MLAIDLGTCEVRQAQETLATLGAVAHDFKHLRLIVVAAGREASFAGASLLVVGPDEDEELAVICGRTRMIDDRMGPPIEALYRTTESDWEPRAIYPLHPAAANGLRRLACGDGAIGAGAAMLREAIVMWDRAKRHDRLLTPAVLMRAESVLRAVDTRLDAEGIGRPH